MDIERYPVPNRAKTQISKSTTTGSSESQGLSWYDTWLSLQFEKLPADVLDILSSGDSGDEKGSSENHWKHFMAAFLKIEECIRSIDSITIDQIIARLGHEGLLIPEVNDGTDNQRHEYARYLILCVLGWQTMLFTPAPLDNGSGDVWKSPQLAIDEQPGYCTYTHMSLETESRYCARESLSEFLISFNVLLPSKNLYLDEDPNTQRIFHTQTEVHAISFNAFTLTAVAGIRIKWVDALACHLEFNPITKELSLFRFPSFCQSMHLQSSEEDGRCRGAIYACATTNSLRRQWASQSEINQLLLECLLSYRLLFGQKRKARTLFRSSLNPFTKKAVSRDNIRDPLLPALCGTKDPCQDILSGIVEKDTYYLPRDFPILRYRISILQRHLSSSPPRTWIQLWRDNRDSASWLTFWAVIAFGIFGSVMAFLQVVLQLVELITE